MKMNFIILCLLFISSSYSSTQLWITFPIRYIIQSGINENLIDEVINEWMNSTCIRFERLSIDPKGITTVPDLTFIKASSCFAHIGRLSSQDHSQQVVGIHDSCATKGVLLHEIGHTLGLHHTHTRRDRDRHVVLKMENIRSRQYTSDFSRRVRRGPVDGVPYDMGSIMHYSITTFSRSPSSATLFPRDSLYMQTIGQRSKLSFYDILSVNQAYCSDKCESNECLNGGYPHPLKCNQCICPHGLTGRLCTALHNNKQCPRDTYRVANGQWNTLQYSQYGVDCTWSVEAPIGYNIEFQLLNVTVPVIGGSVCSKDYVEIKYQDDLGLTGARFCHFAMKSPRISESSRILILLRSTKPEDVQSEFILRYRSTIRV